MTTTINQLTVEEFQKHFNKLPVNYKSKAGIEYVTFITTLSIFQQAIRAEDNPNFPLGQVITCIDKSGNKCKLMVRKFNDPDNEFKMIASMFNTVTGERIALIAA